MQIKNPCYWFVFPIVPDVQELKEICGGGLMIYQTACVLLTDESFLSSQDISLYEMPKVLEILIKGMAKQTK